MDGLGCLLNMGTPTPTYHPIQPVSEFDAAYFPMAEEALAGAFEEDPMTSYLFPLGTNKQKGLRYLFRVELRYTFRHGLVETIGEGRALALWLHPSRMKGAFNAMIQSGAALAPFRMGLKAACRVVLLLRSLHELHSRLVSGDHWYLLGLAVHPQHQGQGWGSELLRHGLARAQSMNLPCYLETTNQRNIAYYERNGFSLLGKRPIAGGGSAIWGMVRPAIPIAERVSRS
jgi:ribosomal protein S18 acetylase RimI-like enzyme